MEYKTVKEYAETAGISIKTVYWQVSNGKLESETKFGKILIKVKPKKVKI